MWDSQSTSRVVSAVGFLPLHQKLNGSVIQMFGIWIPHCNFFYFFQTSFFTEIREIVRPEDLSRFDCLIYQRGNLLDKLLRGRSKVVGSYDEEDQVRRHFVIFPNSTTLLLFFKPGCDLRNLRANHCTNKRINTRTCRVRKK